MKMDKVLMMLMAVLLIGTQVFADEMTIKTTGEYTGEPGLLIDGVTVDEGTVWDDEHCVRWTDKSAHIIIDMGKEFIIQNMMIQVDHNDNYAIDYSVDGSSFLPLFVIKGYEGAVESGIQSVYTDSTHPNYYPGTAFEPVTGRYVKIQAVDGDDSYSIAEISITRVDVPVKEISEISLPNAESEEEPVLEE